MHFPDKLRLEDLGVIEGTRRFRLEKYFRYSSSYGIITVPSGFITDGASIPRAFWGILSPFDDYFHAAVIHDFLYSKAGSKLGYNREQCDLIFKEAMFNVGIPWYKRETIFRAVRMFGGTSYNKK